MHDRAPSFDLIHPEFGLVQFTCSEAAKSKIRSSFQDWLADSKEEGGLSRSLNNVVMTFEKFNPAQEHRFLPITDLEEESLEKFTDLIKKINPCCELTLAKNDEMQMELHPAIINFITPFFAKEHVADAIKAIQTYLINTYIFALDMIVDENMEFHPWLKNLFGDSILSVPAKQRPILITHLTGAVVLWLQEALQKKHAEEFNQFISIVIFNIISNLNNQRKNPDDKDSTVFSLFMQQALRKRPKKVAMPAPARKLFVDARDAKDAEPTRGKYTPTQVDFLIFTYFIQQFKKPTLIVKNTEDHSAGSHLDALNHVYFAIFTDPTDEGNIALFRTVKDFSAEDKAISPHPSTSMITSLDVALQSYKDAKIDNCKKLIIPVAMTSEEHFRLLIIEPSTELDKKTVVKLYDSRPGFVSPLKESINMAFGYFWLPATPLKLATTAKPSSPSLPDAIAYVKATCTRIFGDNTQFSELCTGQQCGNEDCGVFAIHYAVAAANNLPMVVGNIEDLRRLDAQSFAALNEQPAGFSMSEVLARDMGAANDHKAELTTAVAANETSIQSMLAASESKAEIPHRSPENNTAADISSPQRNDLSAAGKNSPLPIDATAVPKPLSTVIETLKECMGDDTPAPVAAAPADTPKPASPRSVAAVANPGSEPFNAEDEKLLSGNAPAFPVQDPSLHQSPAKEIESEAKKAIDLLINYKKERDARSRHDYIWRFSFGSGISRKIKFDAVDKMIGFLRGEYDNSIVFTDQEIKAFLQKGSKLAAVLNQIPDHILPKRFVDSCETYSQSCMPACFSSPRNRKN